MIQIRIKNKNGSQLIYLEKQLEKLLVFTLHRDETFAAAMIIDNASYEDYKDVDINLVPEDFIDTTIEIIQF